MISTLDWGGRLGDMWADKAEEHDRLLGPIGAAGIARLGDLNGKRVLDIGCGAGATSLAMARAGAKVTGIDISESLLAKARARDVDNSCEFLLGDAAQAEFDEPLDVIYSRFGAMFFPEPIAAWTRFRKHMNAGGQVVIVCWRPAAQNEWVTFPLDTAAKILGPEKTKLGPSGQPGPFAWVEQSVFTNIFEGAGWNVSCEAIDGELIVASGKHAVEDAVKYVASVGPLGSRMGGLTPEERDAVIDAMSLALENKLENGEIRLKSAGWIISATP